jgi:hypothetical protein
MLGSIKDFKYKVVDNFLTYDEIKLINKYCMTKHRNNFSTFDFNQSNNADTKFYGDPLMDSLMILKLKKMEEITKLSLLPTYAFWRMYTKNSDLKIHKDRPSCEISVTVMLGSDGTPWPIYMDGNSHDLKPGQAVVYLGCELEHWRKEFEGDWHAQTFLHYVDANGDNKEWFLDKRKLLGEQK